MDDRWRLAALLRENETLFGVIRALGRLGIRDHYVAAGCIAQTVWNRQAGRPPMEGIRDVDVIYFDAADLSECGEARVQACVEAAVQGMDIPPLDVKNEARVHLWYQHRVGTPLAPYLSLEDAIASFPTTASAVGVRWTPSGLHICAPFGLSDLLKGIIRPNRRQVPRAVYEAKADAWHRKWPHTKKNPW